MAVRYRKYFNQCKPVQCTGRRSRQCPETPRRASGDYKTCGTWCIEFFDDNKQWQSLTFKDIRNKSDAEKRLTLFISDRERGQLKLPKKKSIPTLAEYAKTYLELHKGAKENTFASIMQSDLGIGAVTVMGMTGHSSLGMLQKYSHTGLDSKQRAIQALNSHVLTTGRNVSQAVGQ